MAGLGALVGLVLLIICWFAAFHISVAEHADRSIYGGFAGLGGRPRISSAANFIVGLCDPKPYVCLCALPVLVAVARRRLWVALAIVSILLGANFTTQLLKPLFAHPRGAGLLGDSWGAASWPSGHATAAMSLALCCVLAAPSRLRPFVSAAGAMAAVAVAYSLLALESHFASDVLGGFLVASIWTLLGAMAVVVVADRRRHPDVARAPARPSVASAIGPPFAALLIGIAILGLIALARPHEALSYADLHKGFVAGATAIGFVGLTVSTGVMLALRR
jgi:membrane-associated phospholipid phosphatase